jgi:hypothetical protein
MSRSAQIQKQKLSAILVAKTYAAMLMDFQERNAGCLVIGGEHET